MSILIIFVVAIIIIQCYLYINTSKLISNLKHVLYDGFLTVSDHDSPYITTIHYCVKDDKHNEEISHNIENSINTYLQKNKGAVSDFNLIKDIVERNCDTLEAEISSQTPLPLYLGLMGTVAGIILGLFTITVNGGFSNIENVIAILMSDVAIAMVASFMGIGFTTLSLWKSKQCKVLVEDNKNRFYTWIQTNLLPVISKSAVSSITLLQKNLTRFNQTFVGTVERLETKMNDVGDMYESQIDILDKIEKIDIKKMASANVKILSALDSSSANLKSFAEYMENVTDYLTAVRELNDKIDSHLERTKDLHVVSEFYKKQMGEIKLRQGAIKEAVLSVDNVMKSALASLKADSENVLKSMQETFMAQISAMQDTISKQTAQMTAQINSMPQIVQKLNEISTIPAKLDKLIDRIEKSNAGLAKSVGLTLSSRPAASPAARGAVLPGNASTGSATGNMAPWLKWLVIGILAVIALVGIANLSVNIAALDNKEAQSDYNETQTEEFVTDSAEQVVPVTDNTRPDSENSIKSDATAAYKTSSSAADSSKEYSSDLPSSKTQPTPPKNNNKSKEPEKKSKSNHNSKASRQVAI